MSKNTSKKQQSAEQILKRIQRESSEFKRLKTLDILNREQQISPKTYSWWHLVTKKWEGKYLTGKKNFFKTVGSQENRHIAMITIFFTGAIFISWKIEDKYDKMRKRIRQTKSTKEKQVQVQNEYINKMLLKNPFEPVPIQEEDEDKQDYIFEKADIEFDTRADLMQVLERAGEQMRE